MVKVDAVKNFLIISRANLQLGTIPHAFLGILLASNTVGTLLQWPILLYIILYFILITYACNINCYYDMKVDKLYKKNLYSASNSLGKKNIKILILFELLTASVLIIFLYLSNHILTCVIALFGILSATVYSVPPFRVKIRGILSPIPVIVGLYTLPILGGWFLVATTLPFYAILFIFGYACMNEGFTLVNTCEDYKEDKEAGIKTLAHVLGLQNTLNLALLFSVLGYLCILALIVKTFILSVTSNVKIIFILLLIILCFITISSSVRDIWKITREEDKEIASKIYAKKMLQWFLITRYPLLLFALILIV